jgi:acyl carrier protein
MVKAETAEIEARIREFLVAEVLDVDNEELGHDAPLLAGLLDSFGLTALLAFLEETYDVVIDNSEVVAENFGTIRDVAALVQRKRAAAGQR